MWKNIAVILGFAALAGAVAWQGNMIRELRAQLAAPAPGNAVAPLRAAPAPLTPAPVAKKRSDEQASVRTIAVADEDLQQRVATLEDSVAQLTRASEYLMVRGQLPLASNKVAELQGKFLDVNASERDRMQALRLLRRNGAMNDEVVQATVNWLQTATNAGLREDLVEQINEVTNSLVRDPLVRLAMTDPASDVRDEAVEGLRRFVGDPQVEAVLWDLLRNDPDSGVREQAEEALREGPMTDTRLAAMRSRALDANATLDERLLALAALRNAGDAAPDATAALAQIAQTSQDPRDRARVFGAFDGSSDPAMKLPLVYGLQDPDPGVRQRAADALSGYKGDPTIVDWLRYVSENDADPRVRREAQQALRDRR
jgi:hypothetical protein